MQDKLSQITKDLQAKYSSSKFIFRPVDLQSYEAVESAVKDVVNELGDINILINNVRCSSFPTYYICLLFQGRTRPRSTSCIP
jgi:short-subunit dehydrogenase